MPGKKLRTEEEAATKAATKKESKKRKQAEEDNTAGDAGLPSAETPPKKSKKSKSKENQDEQPKPKKAKKSEAATPGSSKAAGEDDEEKASSKKPAVEGWMIENSVRVECPPGAQAVVSVLSLSLFLSLSPSLACASRVTMCCCTFIHKFVCMQRVFSSTLSKCSLAAQTRRAYTSVAQL